MRFWKEQFSSLCKAWLSFIFNFKVSTRARGIFKQLVSRVNERVPIYLFNEYRTREWMKSLHYSWFTRSCFRQRRNPSCKMAGPAAKQVGREELWGKHPWRRKGAPEPPCSPGTCRALWSLPVQVSQHGSSLILSTTHMVRKAAKGLGPKEVMSHSQGIC